MNVVFRVDSSHLIGTGHLMRCLALAESLRDMGHACRFVCRELPNHATHLVKQHCFPIVMLPQADHPTRRDTYAAWLAVPASQDVRDTTRAVRSSPVDWLIIDHYGVDREWEQAARPGVGRILVIDDLANRPHDCDALTEQNFHENPEFRYAGLVPSYCKQWIGPQYALIRSEFAKLRKTATPRINPNRLLVFYGGVDASDETGKALRAIQRLKHRFANIDVVIGEMNPNRAALERQARSLTDTQVHCPANNMALLMASADLSLGAGGLTSWERCTLGLPAIITSVADNQNAIAQTIARQQAGWYAGTAGEATEQRIGYLLEEILLRRHDLNATSKRARSLCDGLGTRRIAERLAPVGWAA